MKKISQLLRKPIPEYAEFISLIKKSDKKYHFLYFLTPLMDYIYQEMTSYLFKNYPDYTTLLSKHLLYQHIYQDFMQNVNFMIIKTCVAEMHDAKRRKVLKGKTSSIRYNYFIKELSKHETRMIFLKKYPVLDEKLYIYVNQKIHSLKDFFMHFIKDRDSIAEQFNIKKTYKLSSIQASGDKHNHGKEVFVLLFYDAKKRLKKIVYKPHAIAIDAAFQDFIRWYNKKTHSLTLRTIHMLPRATYGWVEYIAMKPCHSKKEVEHFYYRLGVLMMFAYLLHGRDLHAENMIAHAAYPMIVDYECFFTPMMMKDEHVRLNQLRHFISDLSILPQRLDDDDTHQGFDISMIDGSGGAILHQIKKWVDIGKDSMHAVPANAAFPLTLNRPKLHGKMINYLKYENPLSKGFSDAYHIMLTYKSSLLGKRSPLIRFKNIPVRIVLRESMDYALLLYECWHPTLLSSKKKFNRFLSLPTLPDVACDSMNHIKKIERQALQENNIPYLSCLTTSRMIVLKDQNIAVDMKKSGYSYATYHIKNHLNLYDLALQMAIIHNSYEVVKLNATSAVRKKKYMRFSQGNPPSHNFLHKKAISLAKRKLHQLYSLYIPNKDFFSWPSIEINDHAHWVAKFSGNNFYDGIPGIVLTFAYGAHIFKNKNYKRLCQSWLGHLRYWLHHSKPTLTENIGLFEGLGGFLYVLAKLYVLWNDKSLIDDMKCLIDRIDCAFESNTCVDIMSGSAGLLIALLTVYPIYSSRTLHRLMQRCVRHILKQYPDPYHRKNSPELLLGMAHGISGMMLALYRYHRLKKSRRIVYWLKRAMLYLDYHFNKEKHNWPDFRLKPVTYPGSWCNGAAGIGMMYMVLQNHANEKNRVDAALKTVFQQGSSLYHCLCHGNVGSLDFFLMATQQYQVKHIEILYRIMVSHFLKQLENSNFQCDMCATTGTPGLLTGWSGVIYELLRLAYPNQIPSVLVY